VRFIGIILFVVPKADEVLVQVFVGVEYLLTSFFSSPVTVLISLHKLCTDGVFWGVFDLI
jgi:hypothetical protein